MSKKGIKPRPTEESDYLECRYCHKKIFIKHMSQHVVKHGIAYLEYIEKYIEDFKKWGWGHCEICGKFINGKVCRDKECFLKHCTKRNLELGRWQGDKNPSYNRELVEKSKRVKKENYLSGKTLYPGKPHTAETKKKLQRLAKERTLKPDYVNPMQGKTHTPEAIQKIYAMRPMNELEKRVAQILDDNKINYYFQFFITDKGICKAYDFKIKGKPIIIEIDGDYWHGGPAVKSYQPQIEKARKNDLFKNKLAQKKGFKLYRIWESELDDKIDIVIDEIINF